MELSGVERSLDGSIAEFGCDCRIAEYYLVDGVALPWSTFASSVSGAILPKIYSGPWGTNGCYINFSDSAHPCKDWSGLGNDYTAVNITSGLISSDFPPG